MSDNMNFDFSNIGEVNIGMNPIRNTLPETNPAATTLNLDLPGEKKELTGETELQFQIDISGSNQNNYFTAMINKHKDGNFIFYLKPEQIQRDAKTKIFKEMIQGRIDYSLFGQYFNDSKFLGNLLIAAQDELINNTTIKNALGFYNMNFPGDQNTIYLCSKYDSLVVIYNVLVDRLKAVKSTSNVGYLADIHYVLGQYRNVLN